MSTSVG